MEYSSSTDQDYDLWILLFQVRNAMFKAREKELSQYGLRPGRAGVLHFIQVVDKATPANISGWLLRERHSISELVDRMRKEDLVVKVKDLDRKNRIRVEITDKGKRAYHKSAERKAIHEIMSCLSEEEHQQLRLNLGKLRDKALKVLGTGNKPPFPIVP